MNIKNLTFIMVAVSLPATAQILNFSLRTNNQQLIDEALSGAFVRIDQSYELCDTIKDQHFGRGGKDYFSIVPFLGFETERGLVFPSDVETPWVNDKDFSEYKDDFKPIVTKTTLSILNNSYKLARRTISSPIEGEELTSCLRILDDSLYKNNGLMVDTLSGVKKGWLVWISTKSNPIESDSVRFISMKKDIEVPNDGECLRIDRPEISDNIFGGIYVTPVQSTIGQLTFSLSGVLVSDEGGWFLEFPFIKRSEEMKPLTPIKGQTGNTKLNPLKKKRK